MTSGKNYLTNQKYFKPNYYEALKFIIPRYLTDDDIDNFGESVDLKDQVLNSNISLADDFSTIINVSSIEDTIYSSVNTVSGISDYFVKQNKLTNITTQSFNKDILDPLGFSINEFETSSAFADYISGTLLPSIVLNDPSAVFVQDHTPSDTHNYLIDKMSWLYFLNTPSPKGSYEPSTTVTETIVNKLYVGDTVETVDGIKMLMDLVWRDGHPEYYPEVFQTSTTTFTSGTQQLDKLKTWIDVIYSPLQADSADFTVRDRFELYIQSNLLSETDIPDGPFTRFLRALSFFVQDINDTSVRLGDLHSISDCPEEFLPLLAELIGWDLFGSDPDRWRLQLVNAVDIYKSVGTAKSIQLAVNGILPKDQFNIETTVTELHESYVPFLIYYGLATESRYFKTFKDWTETLAFELGVSAFNPISLDENIKLVVDKILLETYEEFEETLGPIPNYEKGFNYRGRIHPVPPFEEYPYYINFELNSEIISFIKDRLVCFGCSELFAEQFETYLIDNALNTDDEPRTSSFLLFTSGYNDPPNLSSLIASGNTEKFEYASLWSGKSSHFKVKYDASSFDFTDDSIDSSATGEAFLVASKLAKDFTPAHAIPLINLEIAYVDEAGLVASALPLIQPRCDEQDTNSSRNYFVTGVGFNTYMRDVRDDGISFPRDFTDNAASPNVLVSGVNINDIPRTSLRRRNYEKLLPSEGYYDRTGFNMPVGFDMASGLSGIPLGLVPSSLTYSPVTDHVNLPSIWNQCEDLNSGHTYFEYDVSNTQNIRGASGSFADNLDRTVDRGQLPDIYAVMHGVKEKSKVVQASVDHATTNFYQLSVSNVYQSLANLATENEGDFPNSTEDYYNYSFGRDFHKLYRIYVTDFNQHRIDPQIQDIDGANLFSHTFGPVLYNHNFEKIDSRDSTVVSSLSDVKVLTPRSSQFAGERSYVASGSEDMQLDTSEIVLSGTVSAVELIHTSGSPETNSFSIFRIPSRFKTNTDDPFMFNNTFVLSKSSNGGLPRIRFDMTKYEIPSERPIATNFILPDHSHQAKVKLLVSDNTGSNLGGRQVGLWIHTKPESSQMWSYSKEGVWTQHSALTSRSDVIDNLSHIFTIPSRTKEEVSVSSNLTNYECIDNLPSNSEIETPITRLREADFEEISVNFNTLNKNVLLSKDYRTTHSLLHRKDQKYVVEVFLIPNGDTDKFMLLDTVSLQDLTLKKLSEIFVTGKYQNPLCQTPELIGNCTEHRVELDKDELRKVFRFFNDISGKNSKTGLASRNAIETSTIMGPEGGSKLDYRYRTDFFSHTPVLTTTLIDQINIDV